jgi:hypothetical protein
MSLDPYLITYPNEEGKSGKFLVKKRGLTFMSLGSTEIS